jgi:hypothetical protein
VTLAALDKPLVSHATTDALMKQTTEQVRTVKCQKFTGDMIITRIASATLSASCSAASAISR